MKNSQSLLAALFVSTLAFTSVACDDDGETTKKDAATADRSPDLAVTEGGLDRAPDTSSTEVAADKAPDTTTTDGGVDKAPDTATDGPADVAADKAPDQAVDQAVDLPADTTPDQAPDTTPDTSTDAPGVVNGCVTFTNRTASTDDQTLQWDLTIATSVERCIRIKVGQRVAWSGSFTTHPLAASGGDTPNPIPSLTTGSLGVVTFPTAGTFGFRCTVHPTMTGAVQVVP